jgi:hypothetical protein
VTLYCTSALIASTGSGTGSSNFSIAVPCPGAFARRNCFGVAHASFSVDGSRNSRCTPTRHQLRNTSVIDSQNKFSVTHYRFDKPAFRNPVNTY